MAKRLDSGFPQFALVAIAWRIGLFGLTAGAADTELTNYKSGISLTFSGEKGTAYMEEYLYFDKMVSDRKIVYIRDTTSITMAHNEFNIVAMHVKEAGGDTVGPFGYFARIGAHGLDNLPNTGDEGIIRYRVDREGQTSAFGWTSSPAGLATFPAFSSPIRFASLQYGPGDLVLGSTGKSGGFQRGLSDGNGDEWHVVSVGDDDMAVEPDAKTELQASDGKTFQFVVNPKAPAITVRTTGNAQFYTTPAKVYLAPKIHTQTTFIQPGSGSVDFELRDLYGRDVSYRVNGGEWIDAQAATARLTSENFAEGINTLEYRSSGSEANAKTRTIVKNPKHPSLGENHGHLLWSTHGELEKIKTRLNRAPYLNTWTYIKSPNTNLLSIWDAQGISPLRNPFFESNYLYRVPLPAPQQNMAFAGLVEGFSSVPTGRTKTWGRYAKEMLLNGIWSRIDPVDYERNQSNGSSPSPEVIGAGYYQVESVLANVIAYDILAGHYLSIQDPDGLSPIEDHYIRDVMASAVLQTNHSASIDPRGPDIGMWSQARAIGATMTAMCMKSYSTPYFGTSGFDGSATAGFAFTPHPTFAPTWKQIYATTPEMSATIPGTTLPSLTYDVPTMWSSAGMWGGPNLGYFNLMNKCYAVLVNMNARASPETKYPYLLLGLSNAIAGTLTTSDNDPPVRIPQPLLANHAVAGLEVAARAGVQAGNEAAIIRDQLLLGLVWYDDSLSAAGVPGRASDPAIPRIRWSNGLLHVSRPEGADWRVSVANLIGRELAVLPATAAQIDTRAWPSGMYTVRLSHGTKEIHQKVLLLGQ